MDSNDLLLGGLLLMAALSIGAIVFLLVNPYFSGERHTDKRIQNVTESRTKRIAAKTQADTVQNRRRQVPSSTCRDPAGSGEPGNGHQRWHDWRRSVSARTVAEKHSRKGRCEGLRRRPIPVCVFTPCLGDARPGRCSKVGRREVLLLLSLSPLLS